MRQVFKERNYGYYISEKDRRVCFDDKGKYSVTDPYKGWSYYEIVSDLTEEEMNNVSI